MNRNAPTLGLTHEALGGLFSVTQGEEDINDDQDATARWVWDAAVPFAEWLCDNKEIIQNKRVIELGSGTGLVGLAAAKLGAKVTLTDLPTELPLLQYNADQHKDIPVNVCPCSWGNKEHISKLGTFDIILVSDCLYGRDSDVVSLLLLETMRLLSTPSTRILFAYCYRENLLCDLSFFEQASDVFDAKSHKLPPSQIEGGDECEIWMLEYSLKKT
eukprot:TRINITY_DN2829_c0_g1_i1.p1 TRINITY_DN2829_c0_g1~~TRINITY_DN2829_c0_g1_i1.p1  ORF type:complete len:216 (+),score=27.72 TRINITY_DN2829_c0_g1_i1:51-698(+)